LPQANKKGAKGSPSVVLGRSRKKAFRPWGVRGNDEGARAGKGGETWSSKPKKLHRKGRPSPLKEKIQFLVCAREEGGDIGIRQSPYNPFERGLKEKDEEESGKRGPSL